tara:strand:- start:1191 stop:1445 length:255 start_codon:yes stop_codon:yes gene_type:complete
MKLFGLFDLIVAGIIFLSGFGVFESLGYYFGILLILKGVVFFSFISLIDIIAGVVFVFGLVWTFPIIGWLFILWFFQKGVFSLF